MQINFVSPRSHHHHPPSINHHSYSTQIVGDKSLKYFTDRKIRGLIPDSTFYPFQSPRRHQRSIICVSHVLGRMTATTTTLTVLEHRPVSSCCCCFHCSCHSKILFNPGQPCRWFWSLFGRGLSLSSKPTTLSGTGPKGEGLGTLFLDLWDREVILLKRCTKFMQRVQVSISMNLLFNSSHSLLADGLPQKYVNQLVNIRTLFQFLWVIHGNWLQLEFKNWIRNGIFKIHVWFFLHCIPRGAQTTHHPLCHPSLCIACKVLNPWNVHSGELFSLDLMRNSEKNIFRPVQFLRMWSRNVFTKPFCCCCRSVCDLSYVHPL